VLPDRVDLRDICAGAEQQVGQAAVVGQRDARHRQRQQRGAAAGKQHEDQVAFGQSCQKGDDALCARHARAIGDGMPRLREDNRACRGDSCGRPRSIGGRRRRGIRVARCKTQAPVARGRQMAVLDVDLARGHAGAKYLLHGGGHRRTGLARTDDQDALGLRQVIRLIADRQSVAVQGYVLQHGLPRLHSLECVFEDAQDVATVEGSEGHGGRLSAAR